MSTPINPQTLSSTRSAMVRTVTHDDHIRATRHPVLRPADGKFGADCFTFGGSRFARHGVRDWHDGDRAAASLQFGGAAGLTVAAIAAAAGTGGISMLGSLVVALGRPVYRTRSENGIREEMVLRDLKSLTKELSRLDTEWALELKRGVTSVEHVRGQLALATQALDSVEAGILESPTRLRTSKILRRNVAKARTALESIERKVARMVSKGEVVTGMDASQPAASWGSVPQTQDMPHVVPSLRGAMQRVAPFPGQASTSASPFAAPSAEPYYYSCEEPAYADYAHPLPPA